MGSKYQHWESRSHEKPQSIEDIQRIIEMNRGFQPAAKLDYGDHGLEGAFEIVYKGICENKRIALYADYDVDGTMSCVSWVWFFKAIGFDNFTHYIPHRIREGYGVNLTAIQHLVEDENAEIIITMDTGITANTEAAWCRQNGVEFVCTDHHKIQVENMPDCTVLNPQTHPDPQYQQLCGCGVTFVLLRKLGEKFDIPLEVWSDLLAITAMATICDVVPLGGVNHKIVQSGVKALMKSRRPAIQKLIEACQVSGISEQDVGFRLGPRINAVGRIEDANAVVEAFIQDNPDKLIQFMGECNEKRKTIQSFIVDEAKRSAAQFDENAIIFAGGDWHSGVVGIAAGRLADEFWKPTWLFQRGEDICRGSARSIPGVDVTDLMSAAKEFFIGFGGHAAAGGFSFHPDNEEKIKSRLLEASQSLKSQQSHLWESRVQYDCFLEDHLVSLDLIAALEGMRPFGHGFEEPEFCIRGEVTKVAYYNDKQTQKPAHTSVWLKNGMKVMLFHNVVEIDPDTEVLFLVQLQKNEWRGNISVSLIAKDYQLLN